MEGVTMMEVATWGVLPLRLSLTHAITSLERPAGNRRAPIHFPPGPRPADSLWRQAAAGLLARGGVMRDRRLPGGRESFVTADPVAQPRRHGADRALRPQLRGQPGPRSRAHAPLTPFPINPKGTDAERQPKPGGDRRASGNAR